MKQKLLLMLALMLGVLTLSHAEEDDLGITAKSVYKMKQTEDKPFLFVDVRDPIEIMFIGNTDVVDVNIPFLFVDSTSWNEDKGIFNMEVNPNFVKEIEAELKKRNLPKDTMIVTMCRSGKERGKPSAEFLQKAGFPNTYYVINGFQGEVTKEGKSKGLRIQNGWQNSGLPWKQKLNADKIYRPKSKIKIKLKAKAAKPADAAIDESVGGKSETK